MSARTKKADPLMYVALCRSIRRTKSEGALSLSSRDVETTNEDAAADPSPLFPTCQVVETLKNAMLACTFSIVVLGVLFLFAGFFIKVRLGTLSDELKTLLLLC